MPTYDMEIFLDNELLINVTQHELVPKRAHPPAPPAPPRHNHG